MPRQGVPADHFWGADFEDGPVKLKIHCPSDEIGIYVSSLSPHATQLSSRRRENTLPLYFHDPSRCLYEANGNMVQ